MEPLNNQIIEEIRGFFGLDTITESDKADRILDLVARMNKFRDEVKSAEPAAVSDLKLIYKAISAYAAEEIDEQKLLKIAQLSDKKLDGNWGFSGVFPIVQDFLNSDLTEYGAAEIKDVIIIPGDGVRDTIFTVMDRKPSKRDVEAFLKHIIDINWGEDTRQPWEEDDKRFPKTVSSNRLFNDRDEEVRWLMHPQNLRNNLKVMKIFVLEDPGERIIWDDGRYLYLGNREQYMKAFKAKKVAREFTAGRGDPWEIKPEEIGGNDF